MVSFDTETLRQDFFTLFGLPRQQGLDVDRLERLYQDIQEIGRASCRETVFKDV